MAKSKLELFLLCLAQSNIFVHTFFIRSSVAFSFLNWKILIDELSTLFSCVCSFLKLFRRKGFCNTDIFFTLFTATAINLSLKKFAFIYKLFQKFFFVTLLVIAYKCFRWYILDLCDVAWSNASLRVLYHILGCDLLE